MIAPTPTTVTETELSALRFLDAGPLPLVVLARGLGIGADLLSARLARLTETGYLFAGDAYTIGPAGSEIVQVVDAECARLDALLRIPLP